MLAEIIVSLLGVNKVEVTKEQEALTNEESSEHTDLRPNWIWRDEASI